MNSKKLRNLIFTLHRYIGLAVGLIAIIVGLTGSLLVFHSEISTFDQQRLFGTITPQGEPLPVEVVLNTVKKIYADQPDATVQRIHLPSKPNEPMNVILKTKQKEWTENYVNPYTGAILGNNLQPSFIQKSFEILYPLHYALLGGDIGYKFVGIIGLLMSFMSISGIILWPGWRKLISGFKIKWNAHPKRLYFDIHKVAGSIASVFLIFAFFTGFCWSFSEVVNPMIYALTFSKQQPTPVSVVVAGKSPLGLKEQLQTAIAALPQGELRRIYFPTKPEEALNVAFKLPHETEDYGQSSVYLDQYSGKVLRVDSSLKVSLGDRILNSFTPLHYGTFGGLPTRIFYVFVGYIPLVLFVSGIVMWWYRYRAKVSVGHKPLDANGIAHESNTHELL
ncbi:PepSY-associated TM helix domain-containing protein [Brasilonema octagenarum]|uniref:PepSY domain-containing protein n=1 Tax=Brasilonema octagenarum UFV-OR1 TaxID=417115 RepID=A0ABX1MCM9_9CYAN|nr:PepSY-associated TM helix domain-containing protein [Brasilonema octagenarum]NMF64796.1 PepSY domain-containing protein [Brasilonema octagenarum UFV-OR1]